MSPHAMIRCCLLSFFVLFAMLSVPGRAAPAAPRVDVDWRAFLGRHDLVWEQLPRQWNEGAFIGNGQLGIMAYATMKDNRLDFHLGRQDVTDHRKAAAKKTSMGTPGASVMWDFPRLDVGKLALRPAGKIQDGTMRLHLFDAEMTGSIRTDLGELKFRAFTPRERMVQVIEVVSTEKSADGKPAPWRWEFLPGNPASPRAQVFPKAAAEAKYQTNPNPVVTTHDGMAVCVQPLLAGGDYATAWEESPVEQTANGRLATLMVSTANEVPATGKSAGVAVRDVREARAAGAAALRRDHQAWWHAFYPDAFLTLPDARIEAFYWIQIYKFASASRQGGPAVDLFGPWFRVSQWPGIWWNLNIQLTYWPVYAGNRLSLGENYLDVVDAHFDGLMRGFRDGSTLGDFGWAMHNYWWQLRFAGDWKGVRERWMPKAKEVLAAYLPRLKPDAAGRLELAPMGSPEYHGFKTFPNTNYNLAILRWLLDALIEADSRDGGTLDPEHARWKEIREKLIPWPVDEHGLRIAGNQPVDMSHRHYSHLLGLYPLYVLNPDDPADRDLVVKSVLHWHRLENGKSLTGYSYTGGTSLYASLGMGEEARELLHRYLTGSIGISQNLPNTFYVESGGRNPVIETPLSAASATMDLVLQSWRGKLRVFPAMPPSWKDAAFHQLRGMDGFLVSAVRTGGQTRWVSIRSEAGEPCVVKVPDWTALPAVAGARDHTITPVGPGEFRIDLKAGEQATLYPAGNTPDFSIRALPVADGDRNLYGVKKGKHLPKDQNWPEVPLP